MKFFDSIQSFFNSIGEYVKNFSYLFLIFVGAFVLLSLLVIIITSFAYETMLTKTIDKINKFLEHNPRINDDNLVAFNNLMKASSVPKALRRQWQQFMLYREHPASYYMSFQHCVENPLRNSAYKQQMTVYKILSYILAGLSLVVSIFMATQATYSNIVLQDIIIIPMTILIGYWIISMVLDLIHNATSSDLFQNYQYFEINMDKAMLTLPEFVDYEVLFSQDEIRRGIPVLFAYLQKRAVQEQQELEKARLKTVNHEKFDFDEAGLDGSLVLDRAMRETENFASQRKKYMQETERVNNEITALENNYKEQVKEYQRQVQTSKETVDNLKEQLEQATSTIEINYIKKQIRDEINRQQLAEKDFDTTTDKYNQGLKSLNQEIKHYDDETKKAKEALENAMLSEFNTYSVKVYNNLEKIVDDKMQERVDGFKEQIKGLEGKLEEKNEELENVYTRYQEVLAEAPQMEQYEEPIQEQAPKKSKKNKKKKKGSDDMELDTPNYEQLDNQQYADYPQNDYYQGEYPNEQYNADGNNYDGYTDNYDNAQYTENYDNNQYAEDYNNQYNYDNAQYNDGYDNQYYAENNADNTEYNNVDNNADLSANINNLTDNFEYQEQPSEQYVPLADEQYDETQPQYESQNEQVGEYIPLDDTNNGEYVPLADEPADVAQPTDEQEFVYVPLDEEGKQPEPPKRKKKHKKKHDDEGEAPQEVQVNDMEFEQPPVEIESLVDNPANEDVQDEQPQVEQPAEEHQDDEFDDFDSSLFDFDFTPRQQPRPASEMSDEHEEPIPSEPADDENFDFDDEQPSDNLDMDLSAIVNGESAEADELPAPTQIRRVGRPRKEISPEDIKPKRGVGRPRKVVTEEDKPKRGVGRPRKAEMQEVKRSVGRPRKVVEQTADKRSVGRPKNVETQEVKRAVGRPRKEQSNAIVSRPVGRPRKVETQEVKRSVGRPRKEQTDTTIRPVGRPRKTTTEVKRPVGRPKKVRRGRPRKNG